jgi:hypothetical protein
MNISLITTALLIIGAMALFTSIAMPPAPPRVIYVVAADLEERPQPSGCLSFLVIALLASAAIWLLQG